MNMITLNIQTLISFLITLTGSFISLFVWIKNKNKNLSFDISILSLIISTIFLISYLNISTNETYTLSHSFFENIAVIYVFILSIFILYSHKETILEEIKYGEYILLYIITIISSSLLILSNNLLTIFIIIELLSISLYSLVGFNKTKHSLEASFKYLITGSFATFFFIISLILIKNYAHLTDLSVLKNISTNLIISIAFIFFISGIIFKIALFPMHSWSVDVYCGSPTYITSILVSFIKFSILVVAYKIYLTFSNHITNSIIYPLVILTLTIPTISALSSKNIKKILVYSSISHTGFAAIGFFSSNVQYFYFYVITYTLTSLGAFLNLFLIENKLKSYSVEIDSIKEIWEKEPFLVISLSIFLFSLAGIPPFVGFFSKFYIFYSAIENSNLTLAIIGALSSAVAAYYYIKILIPIFTNSNENNSKILNNFNEFPFTNILIFLLALITIFCGIFSYFIIEFITRLI